MEDTGVRMAFVTVSGEVLLNSPLENCSDLWDTYTSADSVLLSSIGSMSLAVLRTSVRQESSRASGVSSTRHSNVSSCRGSDSS